MSKKDPQYFTVQAKRSLNIMIDADRSMKIYASTVKDLVIKYEPDDWASTSIADYMDAYLNCKVLKEFIEKHIKTPSQTAINYMKENNFDGIFLTKDELQTLYTLMSNFEESKSFITKNYGVTTLLN